MPIFAGMSSGVRQQKMGRLIQKELSDIFMREKKSLVAPNLVTVMEVKISPDLSVATIFFTSLPEQKQEEVLERINAHKSEVRKALGNRIRHQARIVPEIIFRIDETEKQARRMDELIAGLRIPKA